MEYLKAKLGSVVSLSLRQFTSFVRPGRRLTGSQLQPLSGVVILFSRSDLQPRPIQGGNNADGRGNLHGKYVQTSDEHHFSMLYVKFQDGCAQS